MAFFSVFWGFFHASLSPDVYVGSSWPPLGIDALDPFAIPLLNTLLLLSSGLSPKCEVLDELFLIFATLPFSKSRTPSLKRIGPHNFDILSILIGSLLGDGHMEKDGNGYRFAFYQSKVNGEYLLWLHQTISNLGYCKFELPKLHSKKTSSIIGEIAYYYRFRTFTYSSFDWIYNSFYPENKKVVPLFINEYLTPLALAVWMMDDGCVVKGRGFRLSTNSFSLEEIKYLYAKT